MSHRAIVPIDMGGSPSRCLVAPPPQDAPSPETVQAMIEHYASERLEEGAPMEVGFFRGGVPSEELLASCLPNPVRVSCSSVLVFWSSPSKPRIAVSLASSFAVLASRVSFQLFSLSSACRQTFGIWRILETNLERLEAQNAPEKDCKLGFNSPNGLKR